MNRKNSENCTSLCNKTIVLVVSFSHIASDSRVLRQIQSLSSEYAVATIGYGPSPESASAHLEIYTASSFLKPYALTLLLLRRFDRFYDLWFSRNLIRNYITKFNIRCIILNDSTAWPLADLFDSNIVIADAHEFTPAELSDNLAWRILLRPFKLWCSNFVHLSRFRFCVDPYLCDLWLKFSGLRFTLLRNAAPYYDAALNSRATSHYPLRVLHHGIAHSSRRIECMIQAIGLAGNRFKGEFLLVGSNKRYIKYLAGLASSLGSVVLPPVPQHELISVSSHYDAAIISIFPSNLNYLYCLPNKLFQCIQARLPVVTGPTPSIAFIVQHYQIGLVAKDFTPEALANALQLLTPDLLVQMRANLDRAARELAWEREQSVFLCTVHSVIRSGM